MSDRLSPPSDSKNSRPARFRGTLHSDGTLGPIEERFGRRLMRLIDPKSDIGLALLEAGQVDLLGPDGMRFGHLPIFEAYRRLQVRLESRLADLDRAVDDEVAVLDDCLERVRDRRSRTAQEASRN